MEDAISRAKRSFEASFKEADFYNQQTQDENHVGAILDAMNLKTGDKVLDLGTGSGYLAFAIANRYPESRVVGLDIVSDTLAQNGKQAKEQGLTNIDFVDYDGKNNPFKDESFDWVVTRYALHHFPEIQETFNEVARVLKTGGLFFLSDPAPNDMDVNRFIDAYMQLLDDGHNQFYTLTEFIAFAKHSGMKQVDFFESAITFPRKMGDDYHTLLHETSNEIKQSYCVEVVNDACYITEKVLNLFFQKVK